MFCIDESFKKQLYNNIKNDIINLSLDQIEDLYQYWKTVFGQKEIKKAKEVVVFDRKLLPPQQKVPDNAKLIGVDFPTWFNSKGENNLKIMVLGIDPMRNEGSFKNLEADIFTSVVLGTPYGLHMPSSRKGRTKNYWEFITKLAETNFVYLTDIYKTFFYIPSGDAQVRSYDYYNHIGFDGKSFLKNEIDLINPDLIITFGAISYNQLIENKFIRLTDNMEYNRTTYQMRNVLPMVHLSGSTRKETLLKFLNNNNIPFTGNFGDSYYQLVKKYIS